MTPTVAVPAFEIGEVGPMAPATIDGQEVGPIAFMPFTYPFNFTGQPASSVPCGFNSQGLPVGLQIVGDRFEEAKVLRASAAFEKEHPWREKKPDLSWGKEAIAEPERL